MTGKPTRAVVEAWASLVRTERTLLDKVEEELKRAHLPALDWYHVLHEVDRSPKGMLRQSGVQDRTQLAQYAVQCLPPGRQVGAATRHVADSCRRHPAAFRRTPQPG